MSLMEPKHSRLEVWYSGTVQGVGFRYTAKRLAAGFDLVGSVQNLPDGRVRLVAEGRRDELSAFCNALRDSGLGSLIRHEQSAWSDPRGELRGFEIVA